MNLRTVSCIETPWQREDMEPGTIYLAGGPDSPVPWLNLSLLCPCGCGQVIWVGSDPEGPESHRWAIEHHEDGTVTVAPSIGLRGGCRAHFYIRRSRVINC